MMRAAVAVALALLGCGGDDRPAPIDVALPPADVLGGSLLGEACTQPPPPEIGLCHEGEGACHDEPGGSVCRPFCHVGNVAQCAALGGIETITDRGACVCTPP